MVVVAVVSKTTGRGLAPPRKKINSNYDNILFLALGTENCDADADADI